MDGIAQWLDDFGLGQYVALFAKNEITLDVRPRTEEDIGELSPTGAGIR